MYAHYLTSLTCAGTPCTPSVWAIAFSWRWLQEGGSNPIITKSLNIKQFVNISNFACCITHTKKMGRHIEKMNGRTGKELPWKRG